jgi:hypothetical protein
MINNFEDFKSLMNFTEIGDFYWINIIKRRKDNPNLNRSEKIIKTYNIYSIEDLDKCKQSIIECCELNNARAYIHINKRNDKKIALRTLALIAETVASENYNIRRCYDSACGKYHSDENKKWIIDIDTKDNLELEDLNKQLKVNTINKLFTFETLNGYHIITNPFALDYFHYKADIHKDNATLLYFNKK